MSVQSNDLTKYLKRRHSVTKLVAHLIFTTKYRKKLLSGQMIEQLRDILSQACEKLDFRNGW